MPEEQRSPIVGKPRGGRDEMIKTSLGLQDLRIKIYLKEVFYRYKSQPKNPFAEPMNLFLRGWTNYFRIGNSSACFAYVRDWVENKIRRHLMSVRNRHGFG
jgi:hypothetical protein